MTNLINCTPHALTLRAATGEDTIVPPSGTVARVSSTPGALEAVAGVPVPVAGAQTFGGVEGLPEPTPGTMFIVSALVLSAHAARAPTLWAPAPAPTTGPCETRRATSWPSRASCGADGAGALGTNSTKRPPCAPVRG